MSTLDLKQVNLANLTNTVMTSLTCDDNGKVLMDGEEVVDLSEFGSSLTGNGWQKLPSGLIIQWGQVNISGGTASTHLVTLPIAFPGGSAGYRVFPSIAGILSAGQERNPRSETVSSTQFNANWGGAAGTTIGIWFAIGY